MKNDKNEKTPYIMKTTKHFNDVSYFHQWYRLYGYNNEGDDTYDDVDDYDDDGKDNGGDVDDDDDY